LSIIADKILVEVVKSKEGLYTFDSCRLFLVADCFDFFRVYFYTVSTYYKPKVLYTSNIELVLLDISLQSSFTEL
jgi:hypothetical protein